MSQFEKLQKAAALKYSQSAADPTPVVVASGVGDAARRIIKIAQDSGVPVFQDDSLAAVLSQLRSETRIPPELCRAIVDLCLYFLELSPDPGKKAPRIPPAESGREAPEKRKA